MAERPNLADIRARMTTLSQRLGLVDEHQDWGISNASSGRLEEFVTLYAVTPGDVERRALAELVLASADQRLRIDSSADLHALVLHLPAIARDVPWDLAYWGRLDGDDFPLAAWLRDRSDIAR